MNDDAKDQSKPAFADQLNHVYEELGRLAKLSSIESAEREELVAMIKQLMDWVKSEVKLDLPSMGQAFSGDREVYLDVDCNLVVVEEHGEVVKKALDMMDPALFMIVAREVAPRLLKIVAAKVAAIMEPPKPLIRVILLAGKGGSDFTKHPPHFFVMNAGGPAKDLGLSVTPRYTLGTYGRPKIYGPLTLNPNQQNELNLDKFKGADVFTSIVVEVACTGANGGHFRGRTSFSVDDHQWHEITLSAA